MTKSPLSQKNYGEDYATLYSQANEFLDAAKCLQLSHVANNVVYSLLAHSSELALKSFLQKKGLTVSKLKFIGHDIEQLLSCSIHYGFPSNLECTHLLSLADNYKAKKFEYRPMESMRLPNLLFLTKEIEKLESVVYYYICDFWHMPIPKG